VLLELQVRLEHNLAVLAFQSRQLDLLILVMLLDVIAEVLVIFQDVPTFRTCDCIGVRDVWFLGLFHHLIAYLPMLNIGMVG
jgi:hypothetical protein